MDLSKLIAITLVLGLVVMFIISFIAGFGEIYSVLATANYWFISIAIAFQVLSVIALFFRWEFVVRYCKLKISDSRLFMITLAGIAFSHLMPSSRMGGEPVRAYFLKKETGKSASICLSTIIVERIFDALTFSLISLVVLVAIILFWSLPLWMIALLLFAFLLSSFMLFLMIYISVNRKVGMKIVMWFLKKFQRFLSRWKSAEQWEKKLTRDVMMYSKNVSVMIRKQNLWKLGFGYSLLIWIFDMFRTYFIFLALGQEVNLLVIGGAIIIASLAGSVPVSPGGLGLIEASMMVVFAAAGVPLAVAGMVVILDRLISYWSLTLIGLVPSYYLGIKKYPGRI